jgi:very-short-patch-repair endonuclease
MSLTESELEGRFLRLCARAGLPLPEPNRHVLGYRVDCLWPERRLVVELDGYEFHRGRDAFESDRERDSRLRLAGYLVLRFTWRQVMDRPGQVVALLFQELARD